MINIYYHPEKYGLTTVGQIEWCDDPYQFDLTVVWKDNAGQIYWASDSGCSCPSPFEDHDRSTLTCGSAGEFARYVQDIKTERVNLSPNVEAQIVELILRVVQSKQAAR